MKRLLSLMAVVLLATSLHGQTVIKMVSGYVLLDTDIGIGKKGKTIDVFRKAGRESFKVGRVKIIRLQRGLTAAKVVKELTPYRIRLGDFVVSTRPAIAKKQKAVTLDAAASLTVSKVVQDYALLDGDAGKARLGQQFIVSRKTRSRVLDVGVLTIYKIKSGKTVCKIVSHTKPFHVLKGDYIDFPVLPQDDDVDYYFFGDFVGK